MQKLKKNIIKNVIPVLALFIIVFFAALLFKGYEYKIYDLKVKLTLSQVRSEIRLIDIDQASIDFYNNEFNRPWPWPRSFYAKTIDFFKRGGARAIFIDLILSEESIYGVDQDKALSDSMKNFGNVFLPFYFLNDYNIVDASKSLKNINMPDSIKPPVRTGIQLPVNSLLTACKGTGFVSQSQADDSIIRKLNHFIKYKDKTIASLPLAMATTLHPDLDLPKVPFSENGSLKIKFYKENSFPKYPIQEIIQSEVRLLEGDVPEVDPQIFKDKIIFIGSSAPGLLDLRPTPLSPKSPGYLLNATSLENLIKSDYIFSINQFLQWVIVFILIYILHLFLMKSNSNTMHIFISITALIFLLFSNILLFKINYNINSLPLLYGIIFTSVFVIYYKYKVVGKEKRFLKKAFQNYLSPTLLSELINNPHKLSVGGEKRELTVFFSDLAGFTSISEKLPPENVIDLLNTYLEKMTNVVLKNRGYLDKFEGDAVMAFWGAPVESETHAEDGIRTALESIEELRDLNRMFKKQGLPELGMRIGIR